MRKLALVLAAVLLLAGCNRGEDDPTVAADGSTSSTSTSSTAETTTTTTTVFDGGPLPVEAPATTTRAYLADVRVAMHDGYDRVVFEFQDSVPGYRVEVTKRPVTEDGSGEEVAVAGSDLVLVRMENAQTARITGEKVTPVYKGPRRVQTKGAIVQEVVDTGDFEGVVSWVVGLDSAPAGVKVTTLTSPFRLVVDFGVPR